MLQLSRDSSQGPSLAVQHAAAFHLKNMATLAETAEDSEVWEPRLSDDSFPRTLVRHRHISVYLWTLVWVSSQEGPRTAVAGTLSAWQSALERVKWCLSVPSFALAAAI